MSENNTSLALSAKDAKDLLLRTRDEAIDTVIRLMEERDALLNAAKRLEIRGFFNASSCADKATNADMLSMLQAIQKAEGVAP